MNFLRGPKQRFRNFAQNTYEDILRTIFCKRFIRLRRYAIVIFIFPFSYWSFAYELPEYKTIYQNKLYAKHSLSVDIQRHRGLYPEYTEEELAHLHNYMKKNYHK